MFVDGADRFDINQGEIIGWFGHVMIGLSKLMEVQGMS